MSNWTFLNRQRLSRVHDPIYGSTPEDGFNGAFEFTVNQVPIRVIASDTFGWQHVSVSRIGARGFTPSWSIMCQVKDLFWEDEDAVMQLHPPKSMYVNCHSGCLHLWRPTMEGVHIPLPHPIMVGPKCPSDIPQPK